MFTDLPLCEHRPGDAEMVGQADFAHPGPLGDAGVEFARLRIIEEERRAVGLQHAGDFGHDPLQEGIDLQFRREVGHEVEKFQLALSAFFFMRSTNWVLWRATAACVVIASTIDRSSSVNSPSFLLRAWMTPITSPRTVRTGAHRMLRVRKPVCSSTERLNRSSA